MHGESGRSDRRSVAKGVSGGIVGLRNRGLERNQYHQAAAIDERARREQRDVYFISLPSPKKEVSLER
jgi:hypothetical protein